MSLVYALPLWGYLEASLSACLFCVAPDICDRLFFYYLGNMHLVLVSSRVVVRNIAMGACLASLNFSSPLFGYETGFIRFLHMRLRIKVLHV